MPVNDAGTWRVGFMTVATAAPPRLQISFSELIRCRAERAELVNGHGLGTNVRATVENSHVDENQAGDRGEAKRIRAFCQGELVVARVAGIRRGLRKR
jgi:hypothetical protein